MPRYTGRLNTSTHASRLGLFILFAFFLGASAVLLTFEFRGPFRLILPVQSPINAESIIGLAFLIAIFLRARSYCATPRADLSLPHSFFVAYAGLAALCPFLITINAPLVHDSYAHVGRAATEGWREALAFFTHPSGGDLFFRPIGYVTYWLDFKWAAYDPFRWHLWNVVVHVMNCCLVYALAINLGLNRLPAGIGALVFAVHGTRAEPVSWAAARFDLLACFFVLLSLLAANQYAQTNRLRWYVVMILSAVIAVLSKESAYCLPLLILGIIPLTPRRTSRRNLLRASAGIFATCGTIFVYRWWVLKGVGGYHSTSGELALVHFNLIRTIKPLLFRQWALLFFPINWSSTLAAWTKASVVLPLLVMIGFSIWSRPSIRRLSAAMLFLGFAEIPVHHLLLMTADLAGSRVLYLPVLGIGLFWGMVVQGCEQRIAQVTLSVALLIFQFAALTHNLLTWREIAFLAQRTCRAAAMQIGSDDRAIIIRGLPATWHGVFFLRNGFPECVQMNSQRPLKASIYLDDNQQSGRDSRTFEWNNQTEQLQPTDSPSAHGDKE